MSIGPIAIDFQGGSHGNFLEFVCNIISGVATAGSPFNASGAAHSKIYLDTKVFHAAHFSERGITFPANTKKVVCIKISPDDLLPLNQISLLRAGDRGLDNDDLEINTYHKLNNVDYKWVLAELKSAFFENQIENSYNAVKDPSWPDVKTLSDFDKLPECCETIMTRVISASFVHAEFPAYKSMTLLECGIRCSIFLHDSFSNHHS